MSKSLVDIKKPRRIMLGAHGKPPSPASSGRVCARSAMAQAANAGTRLTAARTDNVAMYATASARSRKRRAAALALFDGQPAGVDESAGAQ